MTAGDVDATKEVSLIGHLEKTSKPPHVPNLFRNWHTVKCEIRGTTLYYYPYQEVKDGIHGSARHVKLHTLSNAELVEDCMELRITSLDTRAPKRYFRIPTGLPELTKNEPDLQKWCETFKGSGDSGADDTKNLDSNSPGETEAETSGYVSDDGAIDEEDNDYFEFGVGRASDPSPSQRFGGKDSLHQRKSDTDEQNWRRFSSMESTVANELTFTQRQDTRLRGLVGGISSEFEEGNSEDDDRDRAYKDMKQSQADYLMGPSPELSRSASEGNNNRLRRTLPGRGRSLGDEADSQRASETMGAINNATKDEREGAAAAPGQGWGFAAGLQKVQKTTKGAIKGMR